MKHVLKSCMKSVLPESILNRTDKMGFPGPLQEWFAERGIVREFVTDILSSQNAKTRPLIDNRRVLAGLDQEQKFGRKIWGFLCLELWQRNFHDKASDFRRSLNNQETLA